MLEKYFTQGNRHILGPHKPSLDGKFIKEVYSSLFNELYVHGGELTWFQGARLAEGNFKNELAAADGHTLLLNEQFYNKAPEKALALAGHLFMHMVQWNNDADQLKIASERYSFRASEGEKISPSEFSKAYAYEKNAWEMFLGFLVANAPDDQKAGCQTWLQAQFEEDMFSIDPKGLGLACVYGASDPKTGEFYPEHQKDLDANGLDRQLHINHSWTKKLQNNFRFHIAPGVDPFILNTGAIYPPQVE